MLVWNIFNYVLFCFKSCLSFKLAVEWTPTDAVGIVKQSNENQDDRMVQLLVTVPEQPGSWDFWVQFPTGAYVV